VVPADLDLAYVAARLRARRSVLQPEDVGLPRGRRRRTPGLRREEAAALCAMSPAHYGRLERRCGPRPSAITLARIARGLRFTHADRDRLFLAAGYDPDRRSAGTTHVSPAVMRLLDGLADTPALVVDATGGVLHRTRAAAVLFGDEAEHDMRSGYCRVVNQHVGEVVLRRDVLSGSDFQVVSYTAAPGSELALELATVLGNHRFDASRW
jgi:hypothetical protein